MHRWCVHPSTKAHKHLFNIHKHQRKKRDDKITQKQNSTDSLDQWQSVGGGRWRSVGQNTTAHRPWLGNGKRWAQTPYFSSPSSHWFILWNLWRKSTSLRDHPYFDERPPLFWWETTPIFRALDSGQFRTIDVTAPLTENHASFHTRLVWFSDRLWWGVPLS